MVYFNALEDFDGNISFDNGNAANLQAAYVLDSLAEKQQEEEALTESLSRWQDAVDISRRKAINLIYVMRCIVCSEKVMQREQTRNTDVGILNVRCHNMTKNTLTACPREA